jgi:hypothetical protein
MNRFGEGKPSRLVKNVGAGMPMLKFFSKN